MTDIVQLRAHVVFLGEVADRLAQTGHLDSSHRTRIEADVVRAIADTIDRVKEIETAIAIDRWFTFFALAGVILASWR